MKVEEINKIKIGDIVEINKGIKKRIDDIEYYDEEKRKVRIFKSKNEGFTWYSVTDVFTREEYPEMFV